MPAIGAAAVAGAGWVVVIGPAAESSTLTAAAQSKALVFMETSPKRPPTLLSKRKGEK